MNTMRWQDRKVVGMLLQAAGWTRLPYSESFRRRNTYQRRTPTGDTLQVCLGNTRLVEVDKKLPEFGFEVVGFAVGGSGQGWRKDLATQIENVASSLETA